MIKAPTEFFTVVFRGDVRKLGFNPLTAETIYGEPIVVGIGNAFDEIETLHDDITAAASAREIARECRTLRETLMFGESK